MFRWLIHDGVEYYPIDDVYKAVVWDGYMRVTLGYYYCRELAAQAVEDYNRSLQRMEMGD